MILDELVLHNYGVYKGEHRLSLTPSQGRPIVLIGALNGGGKTTVLEALQIGLFGRNANPVAASKSSYPDYLRATIHSGSLPKQAGVEVSFRYVVGGHERQFRIMRTWREVGITVKEALEVHCDDRFDGDATERWQEFVEQIIPHQISDLFFFDGEKIESLADPTRSAELLRVGVHALLGLDLIDNLIKSLGQVERRRKAGLGATDFRAEMSSMEAVIERVVERRRLLCEQKAEARTHLDEAKQRLAKAERQFETEGGYLFENQERLRADRELAQHRSGQLEERLREVAAGIAPLLLLRERLNEVRCAAEEEVELLQKAKFAAGLEERDASVLGVLRGLGLKANTLATVEEVLLSDRKDRLAASQATPVLGIRPEALEGVTDEMLQSTSLEVSRVLAAFAAARETLARVEAKEAAIPEQSQVQGLKEALDGARDEVRRLSARVELLDEEHRRADLECAQSEQKLQRLHDEIAEARSEDELTRRVIEKSAKSRDSLQRFRGAMRGKHISRLESLVTQSFQTVLRKKSLVQRVSIDPETFDLRVVGSNGLAISPERLSAGERQMLAVSMLWGLARASGRHLPAIIDTPLGRLDSEHRGFLVGNYFPAASHQVILLSTDEEINGSYYLALKPHVGREYLVQYDHSSHSSKVFEGYFPQVRLAA